MGFMTEFFNRLDKDATHSFFGVEWHLPKLDSYITLWDANREISRVVICPLRLTLLEVNRALDLADRLSAEEHWDDQLRQWMKYEHLATVAIPLDRKADFECDSGGIWTMTDAALARRLPKKFTRYDEIEVWGFEWGTKL